MAAYAGAPKPSDSRYAPGFNSSNRTAFLIRLTLIGSTARVLVTCWREIESPLEEHKPARPTDGLSFPHFYLYSIIFINKALSTNIRLVNRTIVQYFFEMFELLNFGHYCSIASSFQSPICSLIRTQKAILYCSIMALLVQSDVNFNLILQNLAILTYF